MPEAGARGWAFGAAGLVLGVVLTLLATRTGLAPIVDRGGEGESGHTLAGERAPDLGPDDTPVQELRVTVETGTVNGAGTENPIVVWFGERRYELSQAPTRDFEPGRRTVLTLAGSRVPRTLGALRRSSILLTLQLNRAQMAASWYCSYASIEVLLEGRDDFATYLEKRDVGWLSQDEPPRRSPAFALQ